MPRNNDEAVEWPDEVDPDLDDVIQRLELIEALFDQPDPELPMEEK